MLNCRYGLLHHVYDIDDDFGLYLNETGMSTMMKRRGYDVRHTNLRDRSIWLVSAA